MESIQHRVEYNAGVERCHRHPVDEGEHRHRVISWLGVGAGLGLAILGVEAAALAAPLDDRGLCVVAHGRLTDRGRADLTLGFELPTGHDRPL
jgi:hypothetical protein